MGRWARLFTKVCDTSQHRAFASGVAQRATAAGCQQELNRFALMVSPQALARPRQTAFLPGVVGDRTYDGSRSVPLEKRTTLSALAVLANSLLTHPSMRRPSATRAWTLNSSLP